MSEQVLIGNVPCDFLSRQEFELLCSEWLADNHFHHVVTLNPEMIMQATHDHAFLTALKTADIRIPDGAGLIWARWFLRSPAWSLWGSLLSFFFVNAERVTGVDTIMFLAKFCATHALPMYLLGGTPGSLLASTQFLQRTWPDLVIFTSRSHEFSLTGPADIVKDIEQKAPAVLLVAYGAPKQSVWIEKYRHQLPSVRIAVGVGGAFAILGEELPRAPRWLRQINLEWLWRLYLEPSRASRIWTAVIQFPRLVKKQKNP